MFFKCEHKDCEGKDREFKTLRGLHIHQRLEHDGKKQGSSKIINTKCLMIECNGRVFDTKRAFSVHFRKMHPEMSKEWYAEHFRTDEWVMCPICGKEYYRSLCAQNGKKKPTCGKRECYLTFLDAEKKSTCLKKYGVDHQMKVPEISAKCHTEESEARRKQTFVNHFGVDNPLKVTEWHFNGSTDMIFSEERRENIGAGVRAKKDQINETIAKRPGGRAAIIENGHKTYKEKTGYDYNLVDPDVRKQIEDDREERTGYRNPWQNPEVREKIYLNENYINSKSRYKKGWYKSTKTGAWEHFDSSYEYIRFLQLDDDENVFYWHKNRSETLKYQKYIFETDSFKEADCIPDLFVVYVDSHIEIEELKGEETLNSCLRADAIAKFCKENDIVFQYKRYDEIMISEKWISLYEDFIKTYKREDWRKENVQ